MFINGRFHWRSRTPTRQGKADPPATRINWAGEPSSAKRRQARRIHDRQLLASLVQLQPGVLVIWERKPYRIVEVREVPEDLWDADYEKAFQRELSAWGRGSRTERPERATWRDRPVTIVVQPDRQPGVEHTHLRAGASHRWEVLPEHYAVCIACGELPPCSHEIDEQQIDWEMARTEELMHVRPGCCLGCGEPVTARQKAVRFPGPNLWRPDLGEHSAVFHGRQECAGDAGRYRKQWAAAGNQETQLTLPDAAGEA